MYGIVIIIIFSSTGSIDNDASIDRRRKLRKDKVCESGSSQSKKFVYKYRKRWILWLVFLSA